MTKSWIIPLAIACVLTGLSLLFSLSWEDYTFTTNSGPHFAGKPPLFPLRLPGDVQIYTQPDDNLIDCALGGSERYTGAPAYIINYHTYCDGTGSIILSPFGLLLDLALYLAAAKLGTMAVLRVRNRS